jgi:sigma-54 dependent transcriptional regulator, acetoin dehydrogenase operon transcriptional activator AcoR
VLAHDWPRNIRELRAALELALATTDGVALSIEVAETEPEAPRAVGVAERHAAIADALRAERGNVSAAARRLGYSRAHLNRLLKQHAIDPEAYRRGG